MNYVKDPFNMGMFYQLKVSFNMVHFHNLDTHIRGFSYWSCPTGEITLLRSEITATVTDSNFVVGLPIIMLKSYVQFVEVSKL